MIVAVAAVILRVCGGGGGVTPTCRLNWKMREGERVILLLVTIKHVVMVIDK